MSLIVGGEEVGVGRCIRMKTKRDFENWKTWEVGRVRRKGDEGWGGGSSSDGHVRGIKHV